jgi:hypothetical protein
LIRQVAETKAETERDADDEGNPPSQIAVTVTDSNVYKLVRIGGRS